MADIADTDTHYFLGAYVDHGGVDSLIEMLRDFKNPITDEIADMLDPHGNTHWKLILKRRGRGRPSESPALFIAAEHDEKLQEYGNRRGAIKNTEMDLQQKYNMTREAIRSANRRFSGTHDPRRNQRRKRKSGRK